MSSLKSKRAIPENGNQKGKGFTSMDSTTAQRRLNTIHAHLVSAVGSAFSHSHLRSSPTAAEFLSEQNYSVVLPEKLQTGKWNVYRSARSPLKLVSRFPDHPDIGTLHDNFLLAVDFFGDNNYLGTRIRVDGTVGEYKWMTYREAATARTAIGCGLIHHGILKGSCIGLYFINRPEWIIVDHACSAYSLISVPLYDTLGPDAVKYIINNAELKAVFCVPQTLNPLLSILSEIPSVRLIVVVGGMENEVPSLPSSTGIQIVTYSRLLNQGRSYLQPFCQPKPDDIATICYTSGTTGTPKGVVLTHGNLIANAAGFSLAVKFNPTDVYISYLPLAHIFERFNQINLAHYGVAVGFYQGDNMRLMDDLAALRPTLFCSVPRLYNRIYAGILNAVKESGTLKERLFNAAYNSKKQAIMNGKSPSPIWDRLVFNKIKARLGGRVRFMASGASPLSPDVMDFLKICFGGHIIEGYGMTETSCVISCMDEGDTLSGHVGSPNPACEIKLVDVPEMNYTSDDQPYPRGEICVRGPIVFQGYYKDEMQTREVLDEDGWLHTGDIGLWHTGGRLKIIDRKKNIFKLAQGEYIAPEKVENVYAKCKFIAQCFIYGDSLNSSLVAIVSVDQDALKAWASSQGIKYKDLEQLCNDPRARAAVQAEMDAVGRDAQLRGFEFAKSVTLVLEPFTMENGLLTPTFKNRYVIHLSSYAGPTSYSSTYYNPGDYQTAGGYPSSSYTHQTTTWNGSNYANYTTQQYSNYTQDSSGAYAAGNAGANSLHYQQHYKQWADYYNQTEVSCAPGTENLSVASTSTQLPQVSQVPGVSGGYPTSNSQAPTTFAPPWRPESSSSQTPLLQPGATVTGAYDSYRTHGAPSFQNQHPSPVQPHFMKPLESKSSYGNFQEQQKTACPQLPNLQYPVAQQAPQNYQPPMQTVQSLETQRVSKLQIQTNPRIASNLPLGLPKLDKEGPNNSAIAKPAYISVSLPKSSEKVLSNDAADTVLKAGVFPKSLKSYVQRALALCKDEKQSAACQEIMKEIITKATSDGTIHTRDWDAEPLFPIPNTDMTDKNNSQNSTAVSLFSKYKKSPTRRTKSRWEPLEEKSVDKLGSLNNYAAKYSSRVPLDEKDRKPIGASSEGKTDVMKKFRFPQMEQKSAGKTVQRQAKRQRLADASAADNGDASSDSDKEQNLTAYYSGAIALANTPEERKRRENRSKRFEKVQGNRAESNHFKAKNVGTGNLYARRTTALVLSKSFEDGGNRAVEDIDWDALTVRGTCQEIEKRYLRLTSAPDPSTVRPEEVLEKALLMVQNSQKNYLYKCDQLKSIRQDLTVQRIRNHLTVKVYEAHARFALEVGDLPEYNQCQSQLKILYAEGIEGCHMEFAAYNLLCVIMHSNNNRDLLSSMSRLSAEAKKDQAVQHALEVRAAVTSGNYVLFFRLYKTAPNLNSCLMDLYVEKMRYKAVSCMSRSYRPQVPVSYIAQVLGFSNGVLTNEGSDEKESDGLEDCVDWLKAHGACLVVDSNGEMQLDAKASSSTLYMPDPEDAVAHGDSSLAVNDFLTRTSS